MEMLSKLERTVLGWLKSVPHLPANVRRWLGDNVWWIAAIGAVLTGLAALGQLLSIFSTLETVNSPIIMYYASSAFVTWVIIKTIVAFIFTGLTCALLAMAIMPLKEKQKKGWVLLFAALLVQAIAVFTGAILTLNPFNFITNIIFGALWIAISAYFIFEIHSQFAHVERSTGVKAKKKTPKATL